MIKLIASDIDGTLLEEGCDKFNPEIYEVIQALKEKGVVFAAASGRSYTSIRRLFKPVLNDIIFVSDNGAEVICRGYEIHSSVMDRRVFSEIVTDVRKIDDCFLMVSGKGGKTYMESMSAELEDLLVNGYRNQVYRVGDILQEDIDIIKCAIYKEKNISKIERQFVEKYGKRLNVVRAGDIWLDFMDFSADKGIALKHIQDTLKIKKEETIVFGDNMNDLAMFKRAGKSYAVANAREEVRQAATHMAKANTDDGVLKVMKQVLAEL